MSSISGGGVDLSHLAGGQAGAGAQPGAQPGGQPGAAQPGGAPGAGQQGGSAPQEVDMQSVILELTDQTWEQAVQLSTVVPVVIDLWATWCEPCKSLGPVLEKVTREHGGKIVLAKIDVDQNPQLAGAFQAQSIPLVAALVGGRPVQLFQGAQPEQQVREVFDQLLELAKQQGVTGKVNAPDLEEGHAEGEEDAEEPQQQVNPEHEKALAALEAGDFATAAAEYGDVLKRNPKDGEARAALAQVKLLDRLQGHEADDIRKNAADQPDDVDAQMLVADLDVSGGHIEDGFLRLLELFQKTDERDRVQKRLLELFDVVGSTDPRVTAARGQLANLLY
jgi:putative thioredoxin